MQCELDFTIGLARYASILNGELVDPDEAFHTRVEVKIQAIDPNSMRPFVMQLGLEMHEGYPLHYVLESSKVNKPMDLKSSTMRLLELFIILSAGHMKAFGFLVVALSINQGRDWVKWKWDETRTV
jgi:hypothetical protein